MARVPMYIGKQKEAAEAQVAAELAANAVVDKVKLKNLDDAFQKEVQDSVNILGIKILDYFKTNDTVLEYRNVYPKMSVDTISYNPNGIVKHYSYTLNLKTSFITSKTLVTVEAVAVHDRSTPKVIFGRDFKRNELEESYQKIIKKLVCLAGEHKALINARSKQWTGGYSID